MSQAPMSLEQMQAIILKLQQENEELKARKSGALKITEKGGLSLYGLGRFPVTLYKGQWLKLFERVEEIKQFIESNNEKLSDKETK